MGSLTDLLQSGATAGWLLPSALVLGVLHGLAAGTQQNHDDGLHHRRSRHVGAGGALGADGDRLAHLRSLDCCPDRHAFRQPIDDAAAPYFQIAFAVLINVIALWMLRRTWREQRRMHAARVSACILISMLRNAISGRP